MTPTLIPKLKQMIQTKLNGPPRDTCRAITDDGTICGNQKFGQDSSGEIIYCKSHIPSEAAPNIMRNKPVKFKLPSGEIIVP